jgi:hypothetical protein
VKAALPNAFARVAVIVCALALAALPGSPVLAQEGWGREVPELSGSPGLAFESGARTPEGAGEVALALPTQTVAGGREVPVLPETGGPSRPLFAGLCLLAPASLWRLASRPRGGTR